MPLFDREHVRREGTWIFPPLIPVSGLAVGWLLDDRVPALAMTQAPFLTVMGGFWTVVGVALMAWALVHQYRRGTDPNPYTDATALVTDGPYGFSRNPIYTADLCIQLGVGLLFAWEWALLLLPATWAGLRFLVIRNEERYLAELFGDIYQEYRWRVRRWF